MKSSKDFHELMEKTFTKEELYLAKAEAKISGTITKLRLLAGLTQEQLAKKAGLNQSAIARIENDESIPRIDTYIKICNALDYKIEIVEKDFARENLISVNQIGDSLNAIKLAIEKLERRQEIIEITTKNMCSKFDKLIYDQNSVREWINSDYFRLSSKPKRKYDLAMNLTGKLDSIALWDMHDNSN